MASWERVPDYIRLELKNRHPSLEVRWSYEKECYQLLEHYYRGSIHHERHLWDYENHDGTRFPLVWDWLYRHICLSDTRKHPMMQRIKDMREERDLEQRRSMNAVRQKIADSIIDDYHYFADIPTFFMGPNMPEARAKYRPSQERILKNGRA